MTVEYSSKQIGKRTKFVYGFDTYEMSVLIKGIPKEIVKLEKKQDYWRQHPKNEGQVTYSSKIHELQLGIDSLKEIQTEFLKEINLNANEQHS